jgi:hypothetical protein
MTITNIHPADALGKLRAQRVEIENQEKVFHAMLVAMGEGAHEGEEFRATVSKSERAKLDMDAVREKLSRQFITANTTYTEVTTVKVVARNGRGL